MERKDAFPENGYPRIDPELRKKVEAIRYSKGEGTQEYFAYDHEIVWYGVDAIFHVQFARDALEVAAGKTTLEDFVAKYRLSKREPYSNHFLASVRPVEDAGIYIPRHREGREISVFSDDYLNRCGFNHSTFRTPRPLNMEIMRRKWELEDFRNEELMRKSLGLAKNLWAISAVNFELTRKEQKRSAGPSRKSLPGDVTDAARGLIKYYWGIVDADDGHSTPPGQWLVYHCPENGESDTVHNPQVFMGQRSQLKVALKQYANTIPPRSENPRILKTLRQRTRQKLAETLLAENILKPEEI